MKITRTSFVTRTRTWVLIAGLSALLVGFGGLIGGSSGIVLFVGIALVFNFAMYWFSAKLALKTSRARPLDRSEAPELYRDVEELAAKAGVLMPSVHLIPSEQPNAFATGRNPKNAALAVTDGLLRYLPRDQVRGVLAHELAHVANRDVLVMTIAAMILQLAVSRQREYLADATAAKYLGEARPLAEALGTLKRGVEALTVNVNPATASLYIANPLRGHGMAALFSTHPPMDERIRPLRALDEANGVRYAYA